MQTITTIRMTPELKGIIDATAAKCHLTIAEVLRAVALGIRTGRPLSVVGFQDCKSTTASGSEVVRIEGGILIPEEMRGDLLRRAIYARCMEELSRPDRARRKPVPDAVEGVDYNVPDAVAAAKLGMV